VHFAEKKERQMVTKPEISFKTLDPSLEGKEGVNLTWLEAPLPTAAKSVTSP
jgi:hypothetical protein